ncbi:response regulator [Methylorubrum populi]|uniref:Response regulator n=1 Tax=Methylobacterium radiotolerans TaxID=31998 RepID=A0ABU7T990_9HYPH
MSEAEARPVVLVVEDDIVTRQAAVEMIQDAGYATCEASNGNAAIRVLDEGEDAGEGVRVVVTDIDMPLGIDGIKLAACIARRWPGIGIIITSGKVRPAPGDIPPDGLFIRKPYSEEGLVSAIRSVMA